MYKDRHDIYRFIESAGPSVIVEVGSTHGSTPREKGTWMLVGADRIFRTIGGGQLEHMAIDKARELLKQGESEPIELQIPLGPHIGQCCGGTVNLRICLLDQQALMNCIGLVEEELANLPDVYIFGAGHVGYALAEALSLLPLRPVLVDNREAELASVPEGLETCLAVLPEAIVREASPGSAFVILTHDHSLDFLIAREALSRNDAAYVGMIGSKTKKATFRNWLRRENDSEDDIENLVCPIGASSINDKRPEIIAALVAAEIATHLHTAASHNTGIVQHQNNLKYSRG